MTESDLDGQISFRLPQVVLSLLDTLAVGGTQAAVVRRLARADLRECMLVGGIADPRVRHFYPRRVQQRGCKVLGVAMPLALQGLIEKRARGLRMGRGGYMAALIRQEWARRGYDDGRDG